MTSSRHFLHSPLTHLALSGGLILLLTIWTLQQTEPARDTFVVGQVMLALVGFSAWRISKEAALLVLVTSLALVDYIFLSGMAKPINAEAELATLTSLVCLFFEGTLLASLANAHRSQKLMPPRQPGGPQTTAVIQERPRQV